MELVDAATDASEATLTSSAGFNPPAPTHTQTHTHSPTFVVSIGYADKSAARSVTGGGPVGGRQRSHVQTGRPCGVAPLC